MSIAPLGIALIGAGRIGQLHAGNMIRNPGARILCVLEQDTEPAKSVAKLTRCQMVSEFEEAINVSGVSVTIHDGLRSLALAEAARRSADNRVPISMSAIS